ncbi:MAG: DUF362 domain-containing protein [Lachnospiraceae bacterium]|nr:DUF362 domain-containing protein [Lachnospiraceae bacterium]
MLIDREKSLVVVVVCDTYDEEKVYEAVRTGVAAAGGLASVLSPDEKVLVKPNFLKSADPDSAVATHPAVLKAVLRLLWEYGCTDTLYGDSPGNDTGARVADRLGLETQKPLFGARFTPMTHEVKVRFPEGMTEKEFYFAEEVTEADAVINVCKMKTHALMRITGAVKNPFGLVCGYRKAMAHVKYPNASLFARMLADIHRCVKPRLHIMDGIVAMEGNGPGAGTPTPMNLLLFSTDPVAIDTVFCHLIGIDPQSVPTNVQGAAMGIGTCDSQKIELILADASGTHSVGFAQFCEQYGRPDFAVERTKLPPQFRGLKILEQFTRRPVIHKERCVSCGICVQHCPVPGKALSFAKGKNHPPVYDYKKCIRCYCCQELCPKKAITVGRKSSSVKSGLQDRTQPKHGK